jgi:hypothetical protein
MKKIIYSFFLLLSANAFAQLPNTDIWLLDISSVGDSVILFSNPINITNRAGYDNQPAFSPDGKYILYTSIRDEKQSDIYKYDLKTKTISQFTKTSTSEYSPTFMPDGKNISVVMVEPDSVQRLWKFPVKGGEPTCIMKDIDSVGYHCWINKDSLALVMITEPATLRVVDVHSQKNKLFATNVSRCMYSYSDKMAGFIYMSKSCQLDKDWLLLNSKTNYNNICISLEPRHLPEESQDFSIHSFNNNPIVFFGYKNKLVELDYFSNTIKCDLDLSKYGITNITRLAVSPDGKKIAIVAESK